jgi:CheY-like chemotaxis protein
MIGNSFAVGLAGVILNMPNPSIMVVDDDRDIRNVMQLVLKSDGYEVQCAEDGLNALQILRSGTRLPDLIFLDLRMPVMNGWQFHEEQARDPNLAAIPTIIISADGAAISEESFDWACAVVAKPFKFDQILDVASRFTHVGGFDLKVRDRASQWKSDGESRPLSG